MLAALLGFAGYDVTCSECASSAWEILEEQTFDVVIVDYQMPRWLGTDFVREARAQGRLRSAAIVLLTAHPTITLEDAFVLRKPTDFTALVEILGDLVAAKAR